MENLEDLLSNKKITMTDIDLHSRFLLRFCWISDASKSMSYIRHPVKTLRYF